MHIHFPSHQDGKYVPLHLTDYKVFPGSRAHPKNETPSTESSPVVEKDLSIKAIQESSTSNP